MRRIILFSLLLAPAFLKAQIDSVNVLKPAAVQAVTSDERSPFAHTDITEQDIQDRDAAQDLPFLIRFAPSVVVTSDAGNGIGYTGMRLRGIDATRVNVTINGVPLNDAESHGVWWVDLPDLGSSVSDLQISRGVGTSTNGPGAFGGSVAINTLGKTAEQGISAKLGGGSFNSQRMSVLWNTGIFNDGWSFEGRASQITSDGYINRASSELFSVYGSLAKRWDSGKVTLTQMNGTERTYQSWYGVPMIATDTSATDQDILDWAAWSWEYGFGADTTRVNDLLANRRQHNYYNYENEVDDYTQNHTQIHLEQRVGKTNIGVALFQTLGAGFYEQYRVDDAFADYGLLDITVNDTTTISSTDFIRRRWLDNTLRGGLFNLSRSYDNLEVDFGGMLSFYEGAHFGRIISADTLPAFALDSTEVFYPDYKYYSSTGFKDDLSFYTKFAYSPTEKIRIQAEAQFRRVNYNTEGLDSDRQEISVSDTLNFFNPKFGFDYLVSKNSRFYSSVAIANREPSRSNYLDAPNPSEVLPEQLTDIEVGYQIARPKWALELGLYHMDYTNQLIPTGAISDVGAVVKMNVAESYRQGIELQAGVQVLDFLTWQGNLTLSNNKIVDFTEIKAYEDTTGAWIEEAILHDETDIAFSPSVIGASVLTFDVWNGTLKSNSKLDVDFEIASKYVGKQYMDNTSSVEKSLPSYLVHDAVIRASMVSGDKEYSLSLFANNILNHMYSANGWTYSYWIDQDTRIDENYVYPQAGRNGFVSLSVNF